MTFEDFLKHFTDFEICSVNISEMHEDEKGNNETHPAFKFYY